MRALTLCILMFCSSCSILVNDKIAIHDSPYPREEVIAAVYDFAEIWQDSFHEDIVSDVDGTLIKFTAVDNWFVKGSIRGITRQQRIIEVMHPSQMKDFPLGGTAIFHELTHSVLWIREKTPDYTHSSPPGPWSSKHDKVIQKSKEKYMY